jgi:hypothetical protein
MSNRNVPYRQVLVGLHAAHLYAFRSSTETGAKASVNLQIGAAGYSMSVTQARELASELNEMAMKADGLLPYVASAA